MAKKDLAYFKKRLARLTYYARESYELSKAVQPVSALITNSTLNPEWLDRVEYYCKLKHPFQVSAQSESVAQFKRQGSFAYYADTKRIVRHFPISSRFDYVFGDVTEVPNTPAFVKSRPLIAGNENSVLLKLNAIRHYQFYKDDLAFQDKKPQAIWRGMVYHPHRREFVNRYYQSHFADVGHSDEKLAHEPTYKGFASISEQLSYRYIVSIEGKDVATNLKWAMASNSLVMMRKPRFETWFMEGRLKPGVHYVELKDDFSDLEEKVNYYNKAGNTDEALCIIENAHEYVMQFQDVEQEYLISLLVAQKYFELQESIT